MEQQCGTGLSVEEAFPLMTYLLHGLMQSDVLDAENPNIDLLLPKKQKARLLVGVG